MSKLRKISHVLVAFLLACAAGGIVWYYVKINTPGVKVVVAAEKLPVGTVIGPQHVMEKAYPLSVAPKDAERSLQKTIGKTIVSGTVFQGEVIRGGHIAADTGSLKAVLGSVAPGKEAIDLPAETAAGMKGVAVGDRVNVFTEIEIAKDTSVVECVAREAVVLRVPPVGAREDSLAAAAAKGAYVIAVTPEESKKVAEGIVRGKKFSITLLAKGGQP
ncbi:MAG: hypothetical protein ACOY40_04685 [Bacillota bacterium]